MGTQTNVLVGAGNLYYGAAADANNAMSDLGFTRDGVTIERASNFVNISVDQAMAPIRIFASEETYAVRTNLAEATLKNIKLAWGLWGAFASSELSDASGNNFKGKILHFGGPDMQTTPSEFSVMFKGMAPGTSKKRLVRLHKCVAIDFGALTHTKNGETVIPTRFFCLEDTTRANNSRIGYFFDET